MTKLFGLSLLAGGLISMMLGAPPQVATAMIGLGDEVETHDLSDLADGETQTYGSGDHEITATREGDKILITLPDRNGDEGRTVTCVLGRGTCQVFTTDESSGARVVVMGGSDGEITKDVNVFTLGTADGLASVWVDAQGVHEGHGVHGDVLVGPGGHGSRIKVLRLGHNGNILTCPEGDTTMRVDEDDEGPYYCPQHDVELEKSKVERVIETIMVQGTDDEQI